MESAEASLECALLFQCLRLDQGMVRRAHAGLFAVVMGLARTGS